MLQHLKSGKLFIFQNKCLKKVTKVVFKKILHFLNIFNRILCLDTFVNTTTIKNKHKRLKYFEHCSDRHKRKKLKLKLIKIIKLNNFENNLN